MKQYEVIDDVMGKRINATLEDGSRIVIPFSEGNRHYAEYLRYTAWVEAGNTPEDFWTRDLDSPEGLEQTQVTEPKEETPQETEGES